MLCLIGISHTCNFRKQDYYSFISTYGLLQDTQRIRRITCPQSRDLSLKQRDSDLIHCSGDQNESQKDKRGTKFTRCAFSSPLPLSMWMLPWGWWSIERHDRPFPLWSFSFVYLSYLSTWKIWKERRLEIFHFLSALSRRNALLRQKRGRGQSPKTISFSALFTTDECFFISDWFLD